MNLPHRILLLKQLGDYILSNDEDWQLTVDKAALENGWFIPEFTQHAARTIATAFLNEAILEEWTSRYRITDRKGPAGTVGIVMAGNIPMAGFHDWMSVFISGNRAMIKQSSKDAVLIRKLTEKLIEWDPEAADWFQFSEMLKGCDAYIATGSNNSSRYFEFYFKRFPHIIRRNRTSVAFLRGNEHYGELDGLADDICLYFGLGCRNVTRIYVPRNYDFLPLLAALKKYLYFSDHHKYRNNYDYNLALHLLNRVQYMSSGSLLLVEHDSLFSPVSQLNYGFYDDEVSLRAELAADDRIQCIVSSTDVAFGKAQAPAINDYADGVDTLDFLTQLTIR